jgi:hypothetical protein
MTEFTKTKIHFALALLGALFALHPFVDRFENYGFLYLGYDLKVFHVYGVLAGLLAFTVYCFGLALLSDRPHSWVEKTGNLAYALAIMILPLYGGLYLASLLADVVGHSDLAWAAPMVALGLGIAWLVISQLLAWLLRNRLGRQDEAAKIAQLADQEIASLNRVQNLFDQGHYDLSVIETWKAIEARLRRGLLLRGVSPPQSNAEALVRRARRAGVIHDAVLPHVKNLRNQWAIAVSVEPVTKESAQSALTTGRNILATIALEEN